MNDELKEEARAKVLQFLAGHHLETSKFELKRKWYRLSENRQKSEFLKDTSAIVNSYGGDYGFIIIGVDEQTKELEDTKLDDSGYKDPADIANIINSNIDRPFRISIDYLEVNHKRLTLILLFPSTDKPHVILKYYSEVSRSQENAIFIRSGSSTRTAGKGDIDRMYLERNNITVERKAEVSINMRNLSGHIENGSDLTLSREIVVENCGSRPLIIMQIALDIAVGEGTIRISAKTRERNHIVIDPNSVFSDIVTFTGCFKISNPEVKSDEPNKSLEGFFDAIETVLETSNTKNIHCHLVLSDGTKLPVRVNMPLIAQEPNINLA